jgi:hypothetical protein
VAVQDDRRRRRVSVGQPPHLGQHRRGFPITVGEGDLVGDPVEGDDPAIAWGAPLNQPQDMPHEREGEPVVIGDTVRAGEHLRAVGMALRRRVMIDPHQDVARCRQVAHSQVYADEVTVPGTQPLLVASRNFMAIPRQLGGIPFTVGRAATPAAGLVLMSLWWTGRGQ